jgi:hypothetical protein
MIAAGETWRASLPSEGASWLSGIARPWWVAGGWALDLFVGHQSRSHKDLDIGIFRRDAVEVMTALPSWEFFEAKSGELTRLRMDATPRLAVNSLWSRPRGAKEWVLELMLDECRDEQWVFRRDTRIQCPLTNAIQRNPEGIPYLAPEIQLLYKARATRVQDQADFDHVVPTISPSGRRRLQESLMKMDPHHGWLSVLSA